MRAAPLPTRSAPAPAVAWRVAIVVLAGALAYANSLSGPFVFDDGATVVDNTSIRDLGSTAVFFPQREVPTAGRPIVNLSFAINYAIGGLGVRGYHVTNLAIHLLCAVVLFGLVRRTLEIVGTRADPSVQDHTADIALAVALIWVLHPLNTETVDYVTQRTESMMALFYLLTMYASAGSLQARQKPDAVSQSLFAHRTVAIACCALGMACKESMVTAPVMVMLYDRVCGFDSIKKALRARWPLYAGLAATWIVLAAVNWSGARIRSAGFSAGVSPWTYLLNQTVMIVRYLRLAVWPSSLVLAYGTPQPMTLAAALPYALVVISLLALTVYALWRRPLLGFLGAWFFMTLAPTSTIVPIATEVGAERRMYLALAAIVTLAVLAVAPFVRRRIGATMLAAVCVVLATATVLRNREYASSLTLAYTALQRWPTPYARTMVGTELALAGRHDEAIAELRQATSGLSKAKYHLGAELFNRRDFDEAISTLQQFLDEEPYAIEAIRARLMMGRALMEHEQYTDAVAQFQRVLEMTGQNDPARTNAVGAMADALFAQEKFEDAIRFYRGYLAAQPDDINGRLNLGMALFNVGDHGGAAEAARTILRIKEDAAAHDLLGRVLGSDGKLDEAQQEFERALRIDPSFRQAREDLEMVRRARP